MCAVCRPGQRGPFTGHLVRDPSFFAKGIRYLFATADAGGAVGHIAAAGYFLLFPQKKVTKEKRPRLRQCFALPCAARRGRRLRNSPSLGAQTAPRPVLEQCSPKTPTASVLLGGAERGCPSACRVTIEREGRGARPSRVPSESLSSATSVGAFRCECPRASN